MGRSLPGWLIGGIGTAPGGVVDTATILDGVSRVADDFAHDRRARQLRRELDPADFDRLREAGFLLTGVLTAMGG